MTLNEGHKKAIVQMYAHGTSIRELAEWYKVDQDTIREIIRPHVTLEVNLGGGRFVSQQKPTS